MSLERLEKLTKKLPLLATVASPVVPPVVEYDVEEGTCIGFGLWNEEGVAVQRAFMSKGTSFPGHTHGAIEWLIVYRGSLAVVMNGERTEIGVGESIQFPEGCPHSVEALADVWMIGVTVPSERGYPDVGVSKR